MKFLLTSAGLSNKTIANALEDLLGKSINGVKLAFIPTAANVEPGDKSWMIDDLNNFKKAGFEVDIVDISAVPKEIWLPRLQDAEVLFFRWR
jgi:dipeptidase E